MARREPRIERYDTDIFGEGVAVEQQPTRRGSTVTGRNAANAVIAATSSDTDNKTK